ncbi:MAG TPA: hypothetical protein DIC49_06160 [Gammaproteobacteria bacterium]|nr:hypothetical protein [Gammaproteobacteria bacterium]
MKTFDVRYTKKNPSEINYLLNLNAHHSHSSVQTVERLLAHHNVHETQSTQQKWLLHGRLQVASSPPFNFLSYQIAFWYG